MRPGQVNGSGDDQALHLKLFAGEVLAEFDVATKVLGHTRVKNLAPGRKSEQFPAISTATGSYHTKGQNILEDGSYLQTIAQGERVIWADREYLAPIFIEKLDETLNHFNARQEYAHQLAQALARNADQNAIRVLMRAARGADADPYTSAPSGTYLNNAASAGALTFAEFYDSMVEAKYTMDAANVPMEERICLVKPAMMQTLMQQSGSNSFLHLDKDFGGAGDVASGVTYRLAGFPLIVCNNFPTDNFTGTSNRIDQVTGTPQGNDYRIDARDATGGSHTEAICFQKQAIGTVKSADIGMETEYKLEYRGNVLVASYAMGHGQLRPECVVEIASRVMPTNPA